MAAGVVPPEVLSQALDAATTAPVLLRLLDGLSHAQQWAVMRAVGVHCPAYLADLVHSPTHYERLLATMALTGWVASERRPHRSTASYHPSTKEEMSVSPEVSVVCEWCRALAMDPSPAIATRGASLSARVLPDAALRRLLQDVPAMHFYALLRAVALSSTAAAQGDGGGRLASVLDAAFCEKDVQDCPPKRQLLFLYLSAEVVTAALTPALVYELAPNRLARLARRHPAAVVDVLLTEVSRLAPAAPLPRALAARVSSVLSALSRSGDATHLTLSAPLFDGSFHRLPHPSGDVLRRHVARRPVAVTRHVLQEPKLQGVYQRLRVSRRALQKYGEDQQMVLELVDKKLLTQRWWQLPRAVRRVVYQDRRQLLAAPVKAPPPTAVCYGFQATPDSSSGNHHHHHETSYHFNPNLMNRRLGPYAHRLQSQQGGSPASLGALPTMAGVLEENKDALIDVALVHGLPDAASRQVEAQRMLNHPAMAPLPVRVRMAYCGALSPPDAAKQTAEYLSSTDVAIRTSARLAQLRSIVLSEQPDAALQLLITAWVKGLVDDVLPAESEPTALQALLGGLAALPRRLWSPAALPGLDALATSLFQKAAIDPGTQKEMERLFLRLVEVLPDCGAAHLPTLVRRQRGLQCLPLLKRLSPPAVERLLRAVLPVLDSPLRPYRHTTTTTTTNSKKDENCSRGGDAEKEMREDAESCRVRVLLQVLGVDGFSPLQLRPHIASCGLTTRLLLPLLKSSCAATARDALEVLFRLDRKHTVYTIIPDLLQADMDWLLLPRVASAVSRNLQGPLLTKALEGMGSIAEKSRFRSLPTQPAPPTRYIRFPTMLDGRRWTAAQQQHYARRLTALVREELQDDPWGQRQALSLLRGLHSARLADGLDAIVDAASTQEYAREWALVTCGFWSDAVSLEELARALTDARARTAMTASCRRLRHLPARVALDFLRRTAALSRVITVQKELMRFVGSLSCDAAFAFLCDFMETKGDDLHRDVMLALMRGMRSFLDREEAWQFFERAVQSGRPAAASAMVQIPDDDLAQPWQQERFVYLCQQLLRHAEESVRCAALFRLASGSALRPSGEAPSPITTHPALYPALLALLVSEKGLPFNQQKALEILLSMPKPAEEVAPEIFRALDAKFVPFAKDSLCQWALLPTAPGAHVQRVCQLLFAALVREKRHPTVAAQLLIACGAPYWTDGLKQLEDAQLLHPGSTTAMMETMQNSVNLLRGPTADAVLALEAQTLRHHAHALRRRLGFAVLSLHLQKLQADRALGAEEEAAVGAALAVYRRDADEWVRESAQLTELKPFQWGAAC